MGLGLASSQCSCSARGWRRRRRSSSRSPGCPIRSSTSACCAAGPSAATSRSTGWSSSGCWPRCCTARSICRICSVSPRSRPGSQPGDGAADHRRGAARRPLVRPIAGAAARADRPRGLDARDARLDAGTALSVVPAAGARDGAHRVRAGPDDLADEHRRAQPGRGGRTLAGLRGAADGAAARRDAGRRCGRGGRARDRAPGNRRRGRAGRRGRDRRRLRGEHRGVRPRPAGRGPAARPRPRGRNPAATAESVA